MIRLKNGGASLYHAQASLLAFQGLTLDNANEPDFLSGLTPMNSIIIGLISLSFGIWGLTVWWWSFAELLRGLTPVILLLIGVLALGAGVSQVQKQAGKARTSSSTDDEL